MVVISIFFPKKKKAKKYPHAFTICCNSHQQNKREQKIVMYDKFKTELLTLICRMWLSVHLTQREEEEKSQFSTFQNDLTLKKH